MSRVATVTGDLPLIDLVVPTIGRSAELRRMVESVSSQAYPRVRLLVIDQNADATASDVLNAFRASLDIVRISTPPCSLSRAKNIGLAQATSKIVAFPDDDCWYPEGLLRAVAARFERDPLLAGLTMPLRDADGRPSNGRWAQRSGGIRRTRVWGRAVSAGIFYRLAAAQAVGPVDESLGLGSGRWLAGEETDQLIRVLDAGFRVEYDVALHVHHPDPERDGQNYPIERWRAYGEAMGHVMRKHQFPLHTAFYHCARPLIGAGLSFVCGRRALARRRVVIARGRLAGWRVTP